MFKLLDRTSPQELFSSKLYNETNFYDAFVKDLDNAFSEVIIESPFVTTKRLNQLLPYLQRLKDRKVRIIVNTRDPHEHDDDYHREEAHRAMARLQSSGIQVLYTVGHHRKLAIIDRHILYEGSLNILSQAVSCEVMRRIVSPELAWQMARFVQIDKFL